MLVRVCETKKIEHTWARDAYRTHLEPLHSRRRCNGGGSSFDGCCGCGCGCGGYDCGGCGGCGSGCRMKRCQLALCDLTNLV